MMELSKYNALVEKINNGTVDNACYVNFFGEDTVYIFPLRKIHQALKDGSAKIEYTYCNRTTAIYNGKVQKATIMIPKELATKLERVNNKWTNPNKTN